VGSNPSGSHKIDFIQYYTINCLVTYKLEIDAAIVKYVVHQSYANRRFDLSPNEGPDKFRTILEPN